MTADPPFRALTKTRSILLLQCEKGFQEIQREEIRCKTNLIHFETLHLCTVFGLEPKHEPDASKPLRRKESALGAQRSDFHCVHFTHSITTRHTVQKLRDDNGLKHSGSMSVNCATKHTKKTYSEGWRRVSPSTRALGHTRPHGTDTLFPFRMCPSPSPRATLTKTSCPMQPTHRSATDMALGIWHYGNKRVGSTKIFHTAEESRWRKTKRWSESSLEICSSNLSVVHEHKKLEKKHKFCQGAHSEAKSE